MPWGCSPSGCRRIRSTTLITRTFNSGSRSRRIPAADKVSTVGMSPAHASTTSGSWPASLDAHSQIPSPRVQWAIACSIVR